MDRFWLLTNTCYGTWLPGAARGFVGRVWEHRPGDRFDQPRVAHDVPGTPCDADMPGLEEESRSLMKGTPILLAPVHAEIVLRQFRETAGFRGWTLLAVSIMPNHFHIVVGVPGDPPPARILGDFKSYATRALNAQFGKPDSPRWWTERGSKRKLADQSAVMAAVRYVVYGQANALVTWAP